LILRILILPLARHLACSACRLPAKPSQTEPSSIPSQRTPVGKHQTCQSCRCAAAAAIALLLPSRPCVCCVLAVCWCWMPVCLAAWAMRGAGNEGGGGGSVGWEGGRFFVWEIFFPPPPPSPRTPHLLCLEDFLPPPLAELLNSPAFAFAFFNERSRTVPNKGKAGRGEEKGQQQQCKCKDEDEAGRGAEAEAGAARRQAEAEAEAEAGARLGEERGLTTQSADSVVTYAPSRTAVHLQNPLAHRPPALICSLLHGPRCSPSTRKRRAFCSPLVPPLTPSLPSHSLQ
jgi:hypothetical protein